MDCISRRMGRSLDQHFYSQRALAGRLQDGRTFRGGDQPRGGVHRAGNGKTADEYERLDPSRPRFIAGSLGPTTRTLSLSPNVNDPGYRDLSFDQMVAIYMDSARGLLAGGADLILIEEPQFDTLNAKAAIFQQDETCLTNAASSCRC